MDSKVCNRCKTDKPFSEFYVRSGYRTPNNPPTLPGHYLSECKACVRGRSKHSRRLHPTIPRAKTEILAIDYLKQHGIPALPGKAVHASHVDVVCLGAVWLEIKYCRLRTVSGSRGFSFNTTPKQIERGFLAHAVMLVCDYGEKQTFHLFESSDPVFYMNGRIKSGFNFILGREKALKHGNNRTVMTQGMMEAAQDNIALIWKALHKIRGEMKTGASVIVE